MIRDTFQRKINALTFVQFSVVLGIVFGCTFYIFYGISSFISGFVPWYISVGFEWERSVPFLPESAIIYLSMTLFMIMPFIQSRDRHQLYKLIKLLIIQTMIACVIFVVLPAENIFTLREGEGLFFQIFKIADKLNLTHNNLPSLHVCFAVTLANFLSRNANLLAKYFYYTWMLLIIISTITIHEHGIVDIIFGVFLAVLTLRFTRVLEKN